MTRPRRNLEKGHRDVPTRALVEASMLLCASSQRVGGLPTLCIALFHSPTVTPRNRWVDGHLLRGFRG